MSSPYDDAAKFMEDTYQDSRLPKRDSFAILALHFHATVGYNEAVEIIVNNLRSNEAAFGLTPKGNCYWEGFVQGIHYYFEDNA